MEKYDNGGGTNPFSPLKVTTTVTLGNVTHYRHAWKRGLLHKLLRRAIIEVGDVDSHRGENNQNDEGDDGCKDDVA